MHRRAIDEYQIGWVCALPLELTAAWAMLDEEHEELDNQDVQDTNNYVLGKICDHNVVIACLPSGVYGKVSAASVATQMLRTFTGIRIGLMVGIGAGVPNLDKEGYDIRLGDVVVSRPEGTHGGVIQYDLGKNLGSGKFVPKGFLRPPPDLSLTAMGKLQARYGIHGSQVSHILADTTKRLPKLVTSGCRNGVISRPLRDDKTPEIHYGTIVSGDELIKNVVERDRLGQEFGAKCIEMEAAGLMNSFPCIVIRGICDYADFHKNDRWQKYAALTAASYAKELLGVIRAGDITEIRHMTETMRYHLGLNLFDAPALGTDFFSGRQSELQEMTRILKPSLASMESGREIMILGGHGGIGKTQLAIAYAKQYHTLYSSVFWLDASSEVTLNAGFHKLVGRIVPSQDNTDPSDDQARVMVSNWLSQTENTRWLLVFDNHDNPSDYDIKTYYPSRNYGTIIITTRQPRRLIGHQLRLGSLTTVGDGLHILATRSGRPQCSSGKINFLQDVAILNWPDPDAHKLVERLDRHPLALATAGAFLRESSVSFQDYLRQYEAKWKVFDAPENLADYPARNLFTTWNISFEQIKSENMDAAILLKFLAFFDNRDIWYELLNGAEGVRKSPSWLSNTVADRFKFESVIQVLTKYCLIERSYETESYSLHVCVHDWILKDLNQDIDLAMYSLALDCVAFHLPYTEWKQFYMSAYTRLIPHAVRLAQEDLLTVFKGHYFPEETFQQVFVVVELLDAKGYFQAEAPLQKLMLLSKERVLGPNDISTLCTVLDLGNIYKSQDKLDKAEQMYQRALTGYEQALGPDHISTFKTVNNLGILYNNQGKLDKAEQMYQRALTGKGQALGPDHTSTLNTIYNLGILYQDQGKLDKAEQIYQRALIGYKQALGPDHTSTLDTINNLGSLYRDQGKLDEAEQMYQRALAGYERNTLSHSVPAMNTLRNYGLLLWDQNKLEDAERMISLAVERRTVTLGPDHPSTITAIQDLRKLQSLIQEQARGAQSPGETAEDGRDTVEEIDTNASSEAQPVESSIPDQGKWPPRRRDRVVGLLKPLSFRKKQGGT